VNCQHIATMRNFFDLVVQDMESGRESWRVMTVLSGAALAISALYLWW
jgi:hypothetical protein